MNSVHLNKQAQEQKSRSSSAEEAAGSHLARGSRRSEHQRAQGEGLNFAPFTALTYRSFG